MPRSAWRACARKPAQGAALRKPKNDWENNSYGGSQPCHARARRPGSQCFSAQALLSSHRDRHAPARHGHRAWPDLGRLRHPVERPFPDLAQPLELSVQAASVSVMATGMVLVIVTRNIDLSVGSILGFVGMIMAVLQPASSADHRFRASADVGDRARRRHPRRNRDRRLPRCNHRLPRVPAFIVTLGACSSGAVRPGWSRRVPPSHRWTPLTASWRWCGWFDRGDGQLDRRPRRLPDDRSSILNTPQAAPSLRLSRCAPPGLNISSSPRVVLPSSALSGSPTATTCR